MLSLSEYELITKKILIKHNPILAARIMRDSDEFGNLVTEVMMADYEWDEGKRKTNSIKGFRKRRLFWAVRQYYKKQDKERKFYRNSREEDAENIKENLFVDKEKNHTLDIENKDFLERIIKSGVLDSRELNMLYYYFICKMTLNEVGQIYNIGRERVRQLINNAKYKLEKNFEYE